MIEWGISNERRASDLTLHVQCAEQMVEKLTVRDVQKLLLFLLQETQPGFITITSPPLLGCGINYTEQFLAVSSKDKAKMKSLFVASVNNTFCFVIYPKLELLSCKQEDTRMLSEKLKRKQAVIERQEEELAAKEKALRLADTLSSDCGQASDILKQELTACKVNGRATI